MGTSQSVSEASESTIASRAFDTVFNTVTFGMLNKSKAAVFEYLFSLVCLAQLDEIKDYFYNLDPGNEIRRNKLSRDLLEREDEEKANGMTLLMYAAYYGKVNICEYFLRYSPNLNHADVDNRTVLFHAVRGQSLECVQLLLEQRGLAINKPTCSTHCTPLLEAVRRGNEEICRLLLAKNANPFIVDIDDVTALHVAADTMSVDVVKQMLDCLKGNERKLEGAINASDKWGWTSMHLAATRDDPVLLKLLISKGGNVHIRDKCGQTPFEWAKQTRSSSAIQTLQSKKVLVTTTTNHGKKRNAKHDMDKKAMIVEFPDGFPLDELQDW